MQLDKLIVETRVRSGWSAIDLGVVLGRMFWLRGVLLYLTLALPLFAVLVFIVNMSAVYAYLILWWFKPLFERPILYYLSRELFNESVGYWKTLRRWRQWLWPCLGWILTVRRLSVNRGMYAPVSLLESPRSGNYGKRVTVLGSKYANESTWLTVVFYHLESFFATALLVLLAIFFPNLIEFDFKLLVDLQSNTVYVVLGTLLTMSVVAPFYTAAGFILYISRRVELEGWDIEICFRDWMNGYTPSPERSIVDPSVQV